MPWNERWGLEEEGNRAAAVDGANRARKGKLKGQRRQGEERSVLYAAVARVREPKKKAVPLQSLYDSTELVLISRI